MLRIDDVTDKPSARGQFDWLDMRLTDKLKGSGLLFYDRVQQAKSAQDAWLLIYGEYHPERARDPLTRREELDKARGVFAHSMMMGRPRDPLQLFSRPADRGCKQLGKGDDLPLQLLDRPLGEG